MKNLLKYCELQIFKYTDFIKYFHEINFDMMLGDLFYSSINIDESIDQNVVTISINFSRSIDGTP